MGMDGLGIITTIIVGGIAGWIASLLVAGGKGGGIIRNVIVGVLGAFIGSYVFDLLGLAAEPSLIGNLIVATVGAVILLALAKTLSK